MLEAPNSMKAKFPYYRENEKQNQMRKKRYNKKIIKNEKHTNSSLAQPTYKFDTAS